MTEASCKRSEIRRNIRSLLEELSKEVARAEETRSGSTVVHAYQLCLEITSMQNIALHRRVWFRGVRRYSRLYARLQSVDRQISAGRRAEVSNSIREGHS